MSKNKSILNEKSIDFLEKYLNNAAPTGYEWEGQKIWMDYLKPYVDEFITDTYGSAVGVINPDAKYKVVIEGHADEISWYVNYISDNGLIYVIRNGGSDHQIAPSKIVNIHTKNGIVKGVFGWPAIHTRNKAKEEAPKPDNIFIDTGCATKEEVEKAVQNAGGLEMAFLEKNMIWINSVITIAPMLGFTGTVVGMIKAFEDIKMANDISPAVVAGGISQALLTTAFGLIVAMIMQVSQNFFVSMIDKLILDMEEQSIKIVEYLQDSK